jgi:hypothetical protein
LAIYNEVDIYDVDLSAKSISDSDIDLIIDMINSLVKNS